jgi:[NiFe] hydrogenase assembly HybE family chaperone
MARVELSDASYPDSLIMDIYRKIHREHMLGLPILNPDLEVETVGFMEFGGYWLGILITPWFMNLMLISRTELCPLLGDGAVQTWTFPGGALKFSGEFEAELGSFQVCSLCSPMRQFANQDEARNAAKEIMKGLFTDTIIVPPEPVQATPPGPLEEMREVIAAPMSKRDFLRGSFLPGRQRDSQG